MSFALAAVLALLRGRALLAALLALLCAAASPVAGLLLALAGLSHTAVRRRPRSTLALAAPAGAVALALAALFPEGGSEPYPFLSFMATVLVVGAFLIALPSGQPLLRRGARIYLLACVLVVAIPTPIGANIERYAVLLAGPLLVCAHVGWRDQEGRARRRLRAMARQWLTSRPVGPGRPFRNRLRFDAIGITLTPSGGVLELEHVRDAF